jgi:hypothetical protein
MPAQSAESRRWIEDLDALVRELPKRHVAPETERPLEAFRADAERVKARLPSMSREEMLVELVRLAASFGDSHTEVPLSQAALGFHRFPLGLYFFGTDLRVVATAPEHATLLGLRLVAVGRHPIADVLARVRPLLGDDFGNPHEFLHSAPAFVTIPEVLVALGFAARPESIQYVFAQDDGQRVTAEFALLSFPAAASALTKRVLDAATGPLWVRHRERWHLAERVDSSDLLYVRLTRSQNQPQQESLARFAQRVGAAARDADVRRVVIDIRQNTGGNFHTTEPLVQAVCDAARDGALARVYVILGRHTYSAAIVFAAQLKHGCDAQFVGEVPRAVPNRQADMETFRLPHSRLEVTYSARIRRPFPELGDATEIPLDLPAPLTWESYRAGRDPALEAILRRRGGE